MDKLKTNFDVLGFIALILTFISILLSINTLSVPEIFISIGIFMIIIATYVYLSFYSIINQHAEEIDKINRNINIYKEISDLKAKVDSLVNNQMKKRGQAQLVPILIRIIQIVAIIIAVYLILKALGINL